MLLRGCMVSRAKPRSSIHLVWINSATLSFMLRRVSFSVSADTRFAAALSSSAGLMASNFSNAACSARCFSACLASHSASLLSLKASSLASTMVSLRLASAASCARRASSSLWVLGAVAGSLAAAAGVGAAVGELAVTGSTGAVCGISIASSSVKALETAASLF